MVLNIVLFFAELRSVFDNHLSLLLVNTTLLYYGTLQVFVNIPSIILRPDKYNNNDNKTSLLRWLMTMTMTSKRQAIFLI